MNVDTNLSVVKTLSEINETVLNLLLLLTPKEKEVILKRFDLQNSGKHTLEQIGQEFSVTRERVRQIERNALAKMRRNVFNTTLKSLHDFMTNVLKLHGGLISEDAMFSVLKSIIPANVNIDKSSTHLAFVLNDFVDCVGNTIMFQPYIKDKNLPDYSLKVASNKIVNELQKNGDLIKIDKLLSDITPLLNGTEINPVRIRSLVTIDKRITILNGDLIGLLEWRHINPRTLREKILYVLRKEQKPLHFNTISEKIMESKFDKRNINTQAVHNELIRHNQFVLIGRGIYALSDWGYEKGTVSDVLYKLLKENGEMNVEDIISNVLKQRQIKRITILLALKNNDKFKRIGRKIYALNN